MVPTSDASARRVPVLPTLLPRQIQIQGFPLPTLRFDNAIEQLTELRKALYYDYYQFITKTTTQE